MGVMSTVSSVKANIRLDDGYTASGTRKYVNTSLGTLAKDAWDDTKAWEIARSLNQGCLNKTVVYIQQTVTNDVQED